MRLIDGHVFLPESEAEEELTRMMRGQINLRRQPVSRLCEFLTSSLQEIVIDETGRDGRYDCDAPYQPGQPDRTIRAVEQLGFELVRARRSIPVLVVTREGSMSP